MTLMTVALLSAAGRAGPALDEPRQDGLRMAGRLHPDGIAAFIDLS
jgi:hypothetical protein